MPEQDVMQQFNAIRERIDTVPSSVSPPTVQDEKTYTRVPFEDETGKTDGVVAYALGSKPQTAEAFMKAYDSYQRVGNRVAGFTFLEPGIVEKARHAFESGVGNPLRSAAKFVEGMPNIAEPGGLREKYDPGVGAYNLLRGAVPSIARAAASPQGAGAAAGTALGAAATAGTSLLPSIVGTALGAGAGAVGADVATGTYKGRPTEHINTFLTQSGIAALGSGLIGGFKQLLGRGFSQRAQQQAAGDLMDLLKKKAAPLSNDPNGLEIYSSTMPGANDIIKVGIKGLRGDIDTIQDGIVNALQQPSLKVPGKVLGKFSSDRFVGDVALGLPSMLNKYTATEVKKLVRQLADQGNKLLDTIGDDTTHAATQEAMKVTKQKIVEAFTNDLTKSSPAVKAAQALRIEALTERYTKQLDDFKDAAEVLHYMRMSIGPKGFDPTLMQKLVQYNKNQGALQEQARTAVFRGANSLEGTDASIRAQVPFGAALKQIPLLNRVPGIGGLNIGKDIGTRYVGNVRGTYPITEAVAGQQTIKAIQDYANEN